VCCSLLPSRGGERVTVEGDGEKEREREREREGERERERQFCQERGTYNRGRERGSAVKRESTPVEPIGVSPGVKAPWGTIPLEGA
jgi:hypothetical protein